jgi:hypothetical protein
MTCLAYYGMALTYVLLWGLSTSALGKRLRHDPMLFPIRLRLNALRQALAALLLLLTCLLLRSANLAA